MSAIAPEILAMWSEDDLLRKVRQFALAHHWRFYHPWRSDNSAKGWPDVVLCRPPQLLICELKNMIRKPTDDQIAWLADLRACGVDARLWRPDSWNEIEETLVGAG